MTESPSYGELKLLNRGVLSGAPDAVTQLPRKGSRYSVVSRGQLVFTQYRSNVQNAGGNRTSSPP